MNQLFFKAEINTDVEDCFCDIRQISNLENSSTCMLKITSKWNCGIKSAIVLQVSAIQLKKQDNLFKKSVFPVISHFYYILDISRLLNIISIFRYLFVWISLYCPRNQLKETSIYWSASHFSWNSRDLAHARDIITSCWA